MNGMPRRFDAGKDAYAHEHRAHSGQDCRHIIANLTLLKYGADPRKYAAIAHQNYRMGGQHLNRSVENRLDNAFHHIVDNDGEDYDAYYLYKCGTASTRPRSFMTRRTIQHTVILRGTSRLWLQRTSPHTTRSPSPGEDVGADAERTKEATDEGSPDGDARSEAQTGARRHLLAMKPHARTIIIRICMCT